MSEKSVKRWSAKRKQELVLRLLRGESLDALSRETGQPASVRSSWRCASPDSRASPLSGSGDRIREPGLLGLRATCLWQGPGVSAVGRGPFHALCAASSRRTTRSGPKAGPQAGAVGRGDGGENPRGAA